MAQVGGIVSQSIVNNEMHTSIEWSNKNNDYKIFLDMPSLCCL